MPIKKAAARLQAGPASSDTASALLKELGVWAQHEQVGLLRSGLSPIFERHLEVSTNVHQPPCSALHASAKAVELDLTADMQNHL